jgi:glycosyltransferase involved in cell wall biosynthesis
MAINKSNSDPLITIGVTTYNRKELLIHTLNSIINQPFSNYEIIVGNDNPQRHVDASYTGINDSRIRYVNHSNNMGELNNMNKLLELGQGKYFTWLADDDTYAPDFIGSVQRALVQLDYPSCVFTSFTEDIDFLNKDKFNETKAQCLYGREFLLRYIPHDIKVMGCSGIFETKYLKQLGGMRQLGLGHSPYSDTLLAIKVGALDRIGYIDSPLIYYRDHEGSISSSSIDLDAYSSAQEDFFEICIGIFKHKNLHDLSQFFLYNILQFWCLQSYCVLLNRSKKLQIYKLLVYLLFIRRNFKFLGKYRIKMINKIIKQVILLNLNAIKRILQKIIS